MKFFQIILCLSFIICHEAASFDQALATEHAALSFAAMCSNNALTSWSVGYVSRTYPDVRNVEVFENLASGTKGYIAYNSKLQAIIVVFRGTDNFQNLIEDVNFTKTKWNDSCRCQVHQGFFDAYSSLKSNLDQLIPAYTSKYPYAKIHVMGHSLGGAMATFFGLSLAEQGRTVQVSTFGSTRVGDPAFYDYFEKFASYLQHYRVVHERDAVPHHPRYGLGFYHVNREIWQHNGQFIICDPIKGEDHNCSWSVKLTSIIDHHEYMGFPYKVDC